MADEGPYGKPSQKTLQPSSKVDARETRVIPRSGQAVACATAGGFVFTSRRQRTGPPQPKASRKGAIVNNNRDPAGPASTAESSGVSTGSSEPISNNQDASAGTSSVSNGSSVTKNVPGQPDPTEGAVPFFLDADTKEELNENLSLERPSFISTLGNDDGNERSISLKGQSSRQLVSFHARNPRPPNNQDRIPTSMPEKAPNTRNGKRSHKSPSMAPNSSHQTKIRSEKQVTPTAALSQLPWAQNSLAIIQQPRLDRQYVDYLSNPSILQGIRPGTQPNLAVSPYFPISPFHNQMDPRFLNHNSPPFPFTTVGTNVSPVSPTSRLHKPPSAPTSPLKHQITSHSNTKPPSREPDKPQRSALPTENPHNENNGKKSSSVLPIQIMSPSNLQPTDFTRRAEHDGSPVMLKSIPICEGNCGSNSRSVKGPKGNRCVHTLVSHVSCLSRFLPEEDSLRGKLVMKTESGESPLRTTLAGGSAFIQASHFSVRDGQCHWKVIPRQSVEVLWRTFQKGGKFLEQSDCFPTPEQWEECKQGGLIVYEGIQRRGDIIYVPFGSWYQIKVTKGDVTMSNWHTFTLPCIANALRLNLYVAHRICDPETPQIRRMLYYYLLNIHTNITQQKSSQLPTGASSKEDVGRALQIFDRLLIEEYTQGNPENETKLLQPSFCDFCGADIFNAAFVCSNHLGISDKAPLPDKCCEVVLCPLCCCEGRSCLCGKLRLCVMHKFDELLSMRNELSKWCGGLQSSGQGLSAKESIDTCDVYESTDQQHIAIGATHLFSMRRRVEELITGERFLGIPLVVKCRGGELRCEEHIVSSTLAVICEDCGEAICFEHLLSVGIHGSEATFRQRADGNWHHIHTEWSRQWYKWKNQPGHLIDDLEDKIIFMASSLTTCKPLSPSRLRLGFYDQTDASGICAAYNDLIPIDDGMGGPDVKTLEVFGNQSILRPFKGYENDEKSSDVPTPDNQKSRKRRRKVDPAFSTKTAKSRKRTKGSTRKPRGKNSTLAADSTPLVDDEESMDALTGAQTSRELSMEMKEEDTDMRDANLEPSVDGFVSGVETGLSADELEIDDIKYQLSVTPFSESAEADSWPATSIREGSSKDPTLERLHETEAKLTQAVERIKSLEEKNNQLESQVQTDVMRDKPQPTEPSRRAVERTSQQTNTRVNPVHPAISLTETFNLENGTKQHTALPFNKEQYEQRINDLVQLQQKLEGVLEEKNLEIIQLRKQLDSLSTENASKAHTEMVDETQPSTPDSAKDDESSESFSDHDSLDLLGGLYSEHRV